MSVTKQEKGMLIYCLILPTQESLSRYVNPKTPIGVLQHYFVSWASCYPVYRALLASCTLILEVRINGDDYAIPAAYSVEQAVTERDILIVRWVRRPKVGVFHEVQPDPLSLSDMKSLAQRSLDPRKWQQCQ